MPFKSKRQRRFMYARHPDIADRWRKESGPQRDLPERSSRQHLVNQFVRKQHHAKRHRSR